MSNSLRAKLLIIVGIAALSLLATLIGSAVFGVQQTSALVDVEQRLVPKLELGPKLLTEFDGMRQAMQDAVAAQDAVALDATLERRNHIFEIIGEAKVLSPSDASLVRWSVNDYYDAARDVSRRLIAGETGESLVDEMARMQAQQNKTTELIKRTTGLSRSELAQGFAAVLGQTRRADRFRIGICLLGLVLVLGVSFATSRGVLVAVRSLSRGFSRFATGDFSQKIEPLELDELSKLAREANQMADSLAKLAEQRAADDWLKEGLALVSEQLRGELGPKPLADRALRALSRHMGAAAGALYWREGDELHLYAHYAFSAGDSSQAAAERMPFGSGLLGEAARADGLTVLDDPPAEYFELSSGLGSGAPRALVFLPLTRESASFGVLELALLTPCNERVRELLGAVHEMLVVGFQAAVSRAALAAALSQSQQLAEQLGAQEEELRVSNQELQTQHEELRVANSELEEHRHILSEQNAELERARLGLQQKAEELGKMSSYKSQFLANMSHELRTPLNSMLLLSHLLADNEGGNLTPKQVDYCKTIHGAGKDLLALINQVLDLAKIEAGRQELELEVTELGRFAEHARRVFEPLAQEKGLSLRVELGVNLPLTIATDALRVERILTNLLGNAIKFTEHGEVALRIARPDTSVSFSRPELTPASCIAFAVSDTGIGIPKEAQERVFAPFEQLEGHANRRYAGTGLGLAICRESALLLGGELVLESRPGQGSTFTCYLPLQSSQVADTKERASAKPSESARALPAANASPASGLEPPRVAQVRDSLLVIEDDPVLCEQLVEIICSRRLRALSAATGREGLRIAREERPQGIVLDVKLPDIDGWAVMEQLRADPLTADIPVHFISGVDGAERGLSLGAVGYLLKPASREQLLAAVSSLTPAAGSVTSVLVVEDNATQGASLRELLARQGLDTVCVQSAAAALAELERRRYGCMILDLGLPDMDGLAVLETLRSRVDIEAPCVIVHTGRALNKRETQQLESYAGAVVLKDGNSAARLIEEIRLFVRHVSDGISGQRRSQPPPVSSDVSLEGTKILLAEDDMRTVYALSALLRGKGADVFVADTGREALELLSAHPDVHCVLMDIMMPEMDGYEAMRRLRQDPRFQSLPVVALTARAMKGEKERCVEAGATEYLTKPVDSARLLQTVRDCVSRGSA